MRKSTVSGIILAIALLLPLTAVCSAGAGEQRIFYASGTGEAERTALIADALKPYDARLSEEQAPSDGEAEGRTGAWIVRFSDRVSAAEAAARLTGWDAVPLSAGPERVFRISASSIEPFERANADALLYCCADVRRAVSDVQSRPDTANADAYARIGLPEANGFAEADPDLIIAVLDTGVFRGHEDFVGVSILSGYDAVEKHAGVHKDLNGHGTAVIGLIAASGENGVGITGVCPGVRILPVRVAAGEKTIYSSDFVSGLRFAADAGAKIINLSFGGYSFSDAEYDAVQYALAKGCILIAAAGNDGRDGHGTDYCYPASYDGVIAVGSCDRSGLPSVFSQRNDSVHILAPGEQLTVPAFDAEENSIYKRVNGTSYAAAVVSGVTGLALSALDGGVRFESAEMLSLLSKDSAPKDVSGYGVLDALYTVTHVNEPQICGVVSGQTYPSKITIRFNRGVARLDGEEFSDGDAVYENGSHLLTVTDGEFVKTVSFRLSYEPALFSVIREDGRLAVQYTGGEATLDGLPYESGSPVSGRGFHLFTLTDPFGDRKEVPLYAEPDPDEMTGAEDGAVYDRPVRLLFAGDGQDSVNGKTVSGQVILTEDGTYTVRMTNPMQTARKTVSFRIERGGLPLVNRLPEPRVWVDEVNGWYAVYGETVDGIGVYTLETGEEIRHLKTGPVRQMAKAGTGIAACGQGFAAVLDPVRLITDEDAATVFDVRSDGIVYADRAFWVLAEGALSEMDPETGLLTKREETDANDLLTDGTAVFLYWPESGRLKNAASGKEYRIPAQTDETPMPAGEWLFASGKAYALPTDEGVSESRTLTPHFTYEGRAIACEDGNLYTSEAVFRLEDGALLGHYGCSVSCLFTTEEHRFLCREDGGIEAFPADRILYAPAAETLYTDPVQTSAYLRSYYWYGLSDVADLAADGSRFCVLFRKSRRALVCENGALVSEIKLPFEPSHAVLDGESLCIFSAESGMLWADGTVYAPAFPFWNAWYASGRLYLNGSSMRYLEDGKWVGTDLNASASDGRGSVIARLTGDHLLVTDGTVSASVRTTASEVRTDGVFVVADRTVYRFEDGMLELWTELEETPSSIGDGAVLLPGAMVRLRDRDTQKTFSAFDARYTALGSGCGALFCCDGEELRQCFTEDVPAFWTIPGPDGCTDGFLYRNATRITYLSGTGFLDGEPVSSGTVVNEPGAHSFRLVLPCGIEFRSSFRVAPALSGIAFLRPSYKLAVNEDGALPVVFLPQGASSIPLFYTADSDCLELHGDGSFRARKEGIAVVTARTEDGSFSARCEVEVTAALLRFDPQSGYLADRVNGLLLNVAENTSAADLLEQVLSPGRVNASSAVIGTGTVITLLAEDGTELDRLTAVVKGDLDGDGFVTLNDLQELEKLLEEGGTDDPVLIHAGDTDGNGSLTSRDVNWLRQMLLFERGPSRRELPPAAEDGEAHLLVPSAVYEGNTVRALIALGSCENATGVSGRLLYDAERFAYAGIESYDWEISVSGERAGRVAFIGTGNPAGDLHPVLSVLLTVKTAAEKDAQPSVLQLRDLVAVRDGRAESLDRASAEVRPSAPVYGELGISVAGMDPFDRERTEYEVSLPYNTFWVDYELVHPEDVHVEVSCPVFVRENRLDVTFRVLLSDGEMRTYLIRAYRDGTRPKNSDSRLKRLSVSGYDLPFKPEQTEYSLTVPRGTARLELDFETSDRKANAVCEGTALSGERPAVRIRVTAENGTETVYVIRVQWLEDESSGEESAAADPPPEANRSGWIGFGIAAAVLLTGGAAAAVILIKTQKKQPDAAGKDPTNGDQPETGTKQEEQP